MSTGIGTAMAQQKQEPVTIFRLHGTDPMATMESVNAQLQAEDFPPLRIIHYAHAEYGVVSLNREEWRDIPASIMNAFLVPFLRRFGLSPID